MFAKLCLFSDATLLMVGEDGEGHGNTVYPALSALHCFIHKSVLCTKLCREIKEAIKTVPGKEWYICLQEFQSARSPFQRTVGGDDSRTQTCRCVGEAATCEICLCHFQPACRAQKLKICRGFKVTRWCSSLVGQEIAITGREPHAWSFPVKAEPAGDPSMKDFEPRWKKDNSRKEFQAFLNSGETSSSSPREEVVKTHIRYIRRTADGYELREFWMNVVLHAWLKNSRAFVAL